MARPRVGPERKTLILDAFERCVVRNGLEATSLDDIAREAGLPRSLIRYFAGNRDELTAALIDRALWRSQALLRDLRDRCGDGGGGAQFARLLFEEYFSHRELNILFMELWRLAMRSSDFSERLSAIYRDLLSEITTRLLEDEPGHGPGGGFDAVYSIFAISLGASLLREARIAPIDPARILKTAQDLARSPITAEQKTSEPQPGERP